MALYSRWEYMGMLGAEDTAWQEDFFRHGSGVR